MNSCNDAVEQMLVRYQPADPLRKAAAVKKKSQKGKVNNREGSEKRG